MGWSLVVQDVVGRERGRQRCCVQLNLPKLFDLPTHDLGQGAKELTTDEERDWSTGDAA